MLKHFSHTVASFCRFGRQAKHSSEMKVVLRCLGIYLNSVNFIQKTSDYLQKLKNLSNEKICFSKMTFPHQLIRVFLIEQIFRAAKIANNEKYHH